MHRQLKLLFPFVLALATLTFLGPKLVAQDNVNGDPGANGADGAPGDPGTDGDPGEAGDPIVAYLFGQTQLEVFNSRGGAGGRGGNGGDGVDGNDADELALPGNGGNGGAGGFGVAIWEALNPDGELAGTYRDETLTRAFGGQGGDGGQPGVGQGAVGSASGGNGGNGGFARAEGVARQEAYAESRGGSGGMGYGVGNRGGDGGAATVSARLQFDQRLATQRSQMDADAWGGNGGLGRAGADGGRGGNASLGRQFGTFSVDTDFPASISLLASAGHGGDSMGGAGGNGGLASFDLGYQLATDGFSTSQIRSLGATLRGGNGGDGILNNSVSGTSSGGSAGNAWLSNNGPIDVDDSVFGFSFSLAGGSGGSAIGSGNEANGQAGGRVNFQSQTFVANSDSQRLGARLWMIGGDGGFAGGTGDGGRGASVVSVDSLSLITTGTADTHVRVNGGAGGTGVLGGDGGRATVIHTGQGNSMPDSTSPFRVEGEFLAFGGLGAFGSFRSGKGGDALVRYEQVAQTEGRVKLTAVGGGSQGGISGDSLATGTLELTSNTNLGSTRLEVTASRNGVADFENLPTVGTNSKATSFVSSVSDRSFLSSAKAFSGYGSQRSGLAVSNSTAIGEGAAEAQAESYSFAIADRDAASNNNAVATATARNSNVQGSASAQARSNAVGHFNQARSMAVIDAVAGTARSSASLDVPELLVIEPFTSVNASIDHANAPVELSTASSMAFRQSAFGTEIGTAGSLHVIASPNPNAIEGFLATDPQISQRFQTGNNPYYSTMVGMGKASIGSQDLALEGGEANVGGFLFLTGYLNPEFRNDDTLSLGLFNVNSTGDGFDTLDFLVTVTSAQSENIIDESFTSLAEAEAWFDGRIVDLIDLSTVEFGFPRITISWSAKLTDQSSFGFDFVVGKASQPFAESEAFSAVPEPASTLWFCLVSTAILAKRRRIHSKGFKCS